MPPKKPKSQPLNREGQEEQKDEKVQTLEVVPTKSKRAKTIERASQEIVAQKMNMGVSAPQESNKVKKLSSLAGVGHIIADIEMIIKAIQQLQQKHPSEITPNEIVTLYDKFKEFGNGLTEDEQKQFFNEDMENFAARMKTYFSVVDSLGSAPDGGRQQLRDSLEKIQASLPSVLQVAEKKKQQLEQYLAENDQKVKQQAQEGIEARTQNLKEAQKKHVENQKQQKELKLQEEERLKQQQTEDRFTARQKEIENMSGEENIGRYNIFQGLQKELAALVKLQTDTEANQEMKPKAKGTILGTVQKNLLKFVSECKKKNGVLFRNVSQIESQKFSSTLAKNKAILEAINESLEIYQHPSTQKNNPKIAASIFSVIEQMKKEQKQNELSESLEVKEGQPDNSVASSVGSKQQTVGSAPGTFTQNQLPAKPIIPIPVIANKSVEESGAAEIINHLITLSTSKNETVSEQAKQTLKKAQDAFDSAQVAKQQIEEVKEPENQNGNAGGALANNSIQTRTVDKNTHNITVYDIIQLNATGQLLDKVSAQNNLTETQDNLLQENVNDPNHLLQNLSQQQSIFGEEELDNNEEVKYPDITSFVEQATEEINQSGFDFNPNDIITGGGSLHNISDDRIITGRGDFEKFKFWKLDGGLKGGNQNLGGGSEGGNNLSITGQTVSGQRQQSHIQGSQNQSSIRISSGQQSSIHRGGQGLLQIPPMTLADFAQFIVDAGKFCSKVSGVIDGGLLIKYKPQTQIFTSKIVKKEPVQFTIAPGSAFKIRSCC